MNKSGNHRPTQPVASSVLSYLNNQLNAEETRALEETFAEDPMLVDAIEGLRQIGTADAAVSDLQLRKYITTKLIAKRKASNPFGFPSWLIITIILLLLLVSIGFLMIANLLQ